MSSPLFWVLQLLTMHLEPVRKSAHCMKGVGRNCVMLQVVEKTMTGGCSTVSSLQNPSIIHLSEQLIYSLLHSREEVCAIDFEEVSHLLATMPARHHHSFLLPSSKEWTHECVQDNHEHWHTSLSYVSVSFTRVSFISCTHLEGDTESPMTLSRKVQEMTSHPFPLCLTDFFFFFSLSLCYCLSAVFVCARVYL